jgi:hypothetical protein
MKYFSGILLASMIAVGTVAARELVSGLAQLQVYVMLKGAESWDIYEGMVLGLQQNPENVQHQCYASFETLKGDIQKMPDYINAISDNSNAENSIVSTLTNNPWIQPNTYFKLLKRGQELSTLFFTFYDKCYFDDLMIAVGRTVNSFSGGFNTMTTLAVYSFNLLNLSDENNDITKMLDIIDDKPAGKYTNEARPKEVGKILGKIFTKIFNVQVPDVQYQVYN